MTKNNAHFSVVIGHLYFFWELPAEFINLFINWIIFSFDI
jgi:hypothetical protein